MSSHSMQSTTVTNFKSLISAYMRQVKDGEEVLITERGQAVARILPVNGVASLPGHLLEMEKRGQLKRAQTSLPDNFWDLPRPMDPHAKLRAAVSQEREESR